MCARSRELLGGLSALAGAARDAAVADGQGGCAQAELSEKLAAVRWVARSEGACDWGRAPCLRDRAFAPPHDGKLCLIEALRRSVRVYGASLQPCPHAPLLELSAFGPPAKGLRS